MSDIGKNEVRVLVFVLADNAKGEPELINYRMTVDPVAYEQQDHFLAAIHMAGEQGYTRARAFDQNDPAGRLLADLMSTKAALVNIALLKKERESGWENDQPADVLEHAIDGARAKLGVKSLGEATALAQEIRGAERTGIDYEMSNFGGLDDESEPDRPRG